MMCPDAGVRLMVSDASLPPRRDFLKRKVLLKWVIS
jgi:hypothetical protein